LGFKHRPTSIRSFQHYHRGRACQSCFIEGHASLFRDHNAAGQNRHVFQHCFATITETWGLSFNNRSNSFQDAANIVHNQSGEGFAFNFFSNDQEWAASLSNLLKYWEQITDVADLLVVELNKMFEMDLPSKQLAFLGC
jgi:hypothetical protein